jgi:hypothetical protein
VRAFQLQVIHVHPHEALVATLERLAGRMNRNRFDNGAGNNACALIPDAAVSNLRPSAVAEMRSAQRFQTAKCPPQERWSPNRLRHEFVDKAFRTVAGGSVLPAPVLGTARSFGMFPRLPWPASHHLPDPRAMVNSYGAVVRPTVGILWGGFVPWRERCQRAAPYFGFFRLAGFRAVQTKAHVGL